MATFFSCARAVSFRSYPSCRWLGISPHFLSSHSPSPSRARRFFSSFLPQNNNLKVFATHTFYKGKGALAMHPGKPTFKMGSEGIVILEKKGSMYLQFAPCTSPRQYDWTRKQVLALSVDELGTLLGLTMSEGCEFFHDPNVGSSNAGMVRKTLKVEPMPDKTGFFFSFTMANKLENANAHLTVPITKGEFAVMRSSFNLVIPYLMGWHAICYPGSIQLGAASKVGSSTDEDWSRAFSFSREIDIPVRQQSI